MIFGIALPIVKINSSFCVNFGAKVQKKSHIRKHMQDFLRILCKKQVHQFILSMNISASAKSDQSSEADDVWL